MLKTSLQELLSLFDDSAETLVNMKDEKLMEETLVISKYFFVKKLIIFLNLTDGMSLILSFVVFNSLSVEL